MYKIIDNALSEADFWSIREKMQSNWFPWFYEPEVALPNKEVKTSTPHFYLAHMFYQNYTASSQHFNMMYPILDKIGANAIIRIKGNLYQATPEIVVHGQHTDFDFTHKGALYYINSNDGYTLLQDGTKIESVENRLLLFDSSTPHSSTTCTNANSRMNININYF